MMMMKTRSKNKQFYGLKLPACDFEKQGSHRIITIKTGFCVEFVRKCIYCGFWNTVAYVYDFIVRYNGPQTYFRFTKSSGKLEILTSIPCLFLVLAPCEHDHKTKIILEQA